VNDLPRSLTSITNSNARYTRGFGSIGAHHSTGSTDPTIASQFWGDISAFLVYNRRLSDLEIAQNSRIFRKKIRHINKTIQKLYYEVSI
jgi:hypothetical protein